MKNMLMGIAVIIAAQTNAQSLSPQVVASAGGFYGNASGSLSWTLGEVMTESFNSGAYNLTQGFQQPGVVRVKLNIRAFLSGPYNSGAGIMEDDLRSNALIPASQPYSAPDYIHQDGGGNETVQPSVLAVTGNDAVVDWVFLELRNSLDDTEVLATRSALLQADGDIVDVDGISAVEFRANAGNYYIAVHHRNHLSVMSFSPIALGGAAVTADFTDGSLATFGTEAQVDINGTKALWQGDITNDGLVKYTGANNDRDQVLLEIGGSVPTNTASGYLNTDVNMDGEVKYTGGNNDRDPILIVIGGAVPTATRAEQMP